MVVFLFFHRYLGGVGLDVWGQHRGRRTPLLLCGGHRHEGDIDDDGSIEWGQRRRRDRQINSIPQYGLFPALH